LSETLPVVCTRTRWSRQGKQSLENGGTAAEIYRLLASELVIDACSAGDPTAVKERLTAIDGVELLDTSDAVEDLADALVANGRFRPLSHATLIISQSPP